MKDSDIIFKTSGEKEEVEMLFRKFYKPLVLYAWRYLEEKEEAEDVVQEVFVNFWNRMKQADVGNNTKAYLYHSTRNNCLNRIANRKGVRSGGLDELTDLAEEQLPEEEKWLEHLEEIYQAIEELPEKTRFVFKAIVLENKKYKQVAEEQQISVNTVKTLVSRSLSLLRNKLSNRSFVFFISFFSFPDE